MRTPAEVLRALNLAARQGKINTITFLEQNFIPEGHSPSEPIQCEPWQKEHILKPVFEKIGGKRPWDTFLIGLPKKNGKSTMGSCVATYALFLDDPYPEVYSAAGDKDQAKIIFNYTKKAFKRSSRLRPLVKIYKDVIERVDGNGIYRVLASDSSGNHGLNPSCVIWDELWNQSSYDLWEALTFSPARKNPFHFIVTYAGYSSHSGNLLWDLYSRGMANEDPRQYTFWCSGPEANRASWVTAEYLESQRRRVPDHMFRRLHYNEWSVAEATKVFRVPQECYQGTFQDPVPGATYAAGIDLGNIVISPLV